jgi:pimeloyl-ACP methyl ester carboxylesterase
MPLITLAKIPLSLLSWLVLGASAWLLWSWYDGEWVRDATGELVRLRDDWRLWVGLALLAWSFLGRLVALPILARPDREPPSRPERSEGRLTTGDSGSRLFVGSEGPETAPLILMTHGWGLDSTIWNSLRRALGGRFGLMTWDLPGLGRSRPAAAITLPAFAADLRGLVERAGRPVVLVGHSIGGMVIQTLARDHPELFGRQVAGVVLLNTTHTNPLRTMALSGLAQALRRPVIEPLMKLAIALKPLVWLSAWQGYLSGSSHIANRLGFGAYVTRSQLEHTTLLATRNDPAAQARGNLAMFDWDAGSGPANLKVPTLVIGGDVDIVTRLEASRTITQTAPAATLRIVEGVNHMGFLERSDVYAAAIADFVEVLTRGATHADRPPVQWQRQVSPADGSGTSPSSEARTWE